MALSFQSSTHRDRPTAGTWSRRIVDASLAGCVLIVPFLMAGRHPLGELVLVALVVTAALAWVSGQAISPRTCLHVTWLTPLFVAGVALLIVQQIPLPESVLAKLSPKIAELLPLWHSQGGAPAAIGSWQTLSLKPAATRSGMFLLAAYGLLYFVTVQRIRCLADVQRLLRWIAWATVLTAAYGLIQYLTGNGKFFWFYEHPYSDAGDVVKANFSNRNHFAQFLALGVGPLLWWIQDAFHMIAGRRGPTSPVATSTFRAQSQPGRIHHQTTTERQELWAYGLVLLLGIVLFAALLSLSKGGASAIVVATILAAAVTFRARSGGRSWMVVLAIVGLLVAVSLNIFGLDRLADRFVGLSSCSIERLDRDKGRRSIWTAVRRAIPDFAALGAGVGTHAEVYPIYYSNELCEADTEFTHAENSYLQVGLETGYTGLLLVAAAIGCCGFWCVGGLWRSSSASVSTCLGAVTAGLAANAVHAIVDFIWYVPACMVVVILLAACAARLYQFAKTEVVGRAANLPNPGRSTTCPTTRMPPGRSSQWAYLASFAVLLPVGVGMVKSCVPAALAAPAWDSYCRSRVATQRNAKPTDNGGNPSEAAGMRRAEEASIDLLETVLRWNPEHARAHLDLAECCLRLFDAMQTTGENPMSLGNVRDAALRSRLAPREAMEWCRRAIGPHAEYLARALAHTHRALALCPLQGRGYVFLGELCFLEPGGEAAKESYLAQAIRARPFDGEVLHAVAAEALFARDYDRWLELSRASFACGRPHQKRIITELFEQTTPETLPAMIEFVVREFHPNREGLADVSEAASRRGRPEQLVWLKRCQAAQTEADATVASGETAAGLWAEAHALHAALGDPRRALDCAENAASAAPQNFEARHALAVALLDAGRPAEAEPHLHWCLQQRPNDARVGTQWKTALKGRLDQAPLKGSEFGVQGSELVSRSSSKGSGFEGQGSELVSRNSLDIPKTDRFERSDQEDKASMR